MFSYILESLIVADTLHEVTKGAVVAKFSWVSFL